MRPDSDPAAEDKPMRHQGQRQPGILVEILISRQGPAIQRQFEQLQPLAIEL